MNEMAVKNPNYVFKIFKVLCKHDVELALFPGLLLICPSENVAVFVMGFLQYKDGARNCIKGLFDGAI